MRLRVKKLNKDAKLPTKATPGSVCYDVYSTKRVLFSPMEKAIVPTGLSFKLPMDIGMDIRPRSGLASRGLIILNSPGTLDSDYRGELLISCMNLSNGNILVNKGDRIAQIRLFKDIYIEFNEVEDIGETRRGEGGFGSTGK
jgi:dUTP pyrophosphatase